MGILFPILLHYSTEHFKYDELFGRIYLKVQLRDISVNGFKTAGIYFANKNVFCYVDFTASTLTDSRPQAYRSTNGPIPCSSTSYDKPQPCSTKSPDVFVKDVPTNFVLSGEISPHPLKPTGGEVVREVSF